MESERRQANRWRGRLRSGKLFDTAKRFLVSCRVIDISEIGARLQPDSDRPLPLELHYRADDDEDFRAASLIWVRKRQIGIHFTPPKPSEPQAGAVPPSP